MRPHTTSAPQRSAHARLLLVIASACAGLLTTTGPAAAAPILAPAAVDDTTDADTTDADTTDADTTVDDATVDDTTDADTTDADTTDADTTDADTTDADTTVADTTVADTTGADAKMQEVSRFFRAAEQQEREGHHVAAADLYIKAYDLLDDPRKYRNPRGTTLARIYAALQTAYESAPNDAAKTHHACLLRSVLSDHLSGLRSGYGTASEDFPEFKVGDEKLRATNLTIAAHGDPKVICAKPENAPQRKRIALISPAVPGPGSHRISDPGTSEAGPPPPKKPQPYGPIVDDFAPRRDRKAVAMTAVGGTLIGLGAVSFGVMTGAVIVGAQRSQDVVTLQTELRALQTEYNTLKEEIDMLKMTSENADEDPEIAAKEATLRAKEATLLAREDARDQPRSEGHMANQVAIATGVVGGAAIVTGIILTALGRKRSRSSKLSMIPQASRTSLGATLRLNF